MAKADLLREARKQIAFSYVHKVVLFSVACFGFYALNWLSEHKRVFDERQRIVTGGIINVVNYAAQTQTCIDPGEGKKFATREQLIAAMQDRAEACVWRDIRSTVDGVRANMAEIARRKSLTKEDLENYTRYANFIAREEAYAGIKAGSARQYVRAMLTSKNFEEEEEKGRPRLERNPERLSALIRPTLAEESSLHVLYEILWYAALLLGVAASSMLFVVILTALPITNGEGYWTKRIGEILDRIPSVAGRTIAAPLLVAAIGGGTLAGAMAETQAGGQERPAMETGRPIDIPPQSPPKSPTETPPASTSAGGTSPFAYRAGDTYDVGNLNILGELSTTTPACEPAALLEWLQGIDQSLRTLASQTDQSRRDIVAAIERLGPKIDNLSQVGRDAKERIQHVQEVVDGTQKTATDILGRVDSLADNVKATLHEHEHESVEAARSLKELETEQADAFSQTLAESAESDPRGPWRRIFGLTHFKIGPAVPRTIKARLGDTPSNEEKSLLDVLETMTKEEPLNRWAFEHRLRTKLGPKPDGLGLTKDQIDALMKDHLNALLHICALPRR
jgi:hypothetical protein